MRIVAALFVTAFAGFVFGQTSLTGITWRAQMLNGTSVGTMTYTIKFLANDSAALGNIDCNSCGWTYRTSGQSITIISGFCTMMACIGQSRAGEYEAALGSATKYAVNNSHLYLMNNSDTLAVFVDEAGPVEDLIAKVHPARIFEIMTKEKAMVVAVSGDAIRLVRLLDMRGKCVSQSSKPNSQYVFLNTTTLPAGIYLLEVTGWSGLSGIRLITIMR
jgi:heat shock protein HslJ